MANIKEFCEEYQNKTFTILPLEEMKKNPVVFEQESTNGGYLTNIGVCKFFDQNTGKLYTVYIEVISHQLGTKYKRRTCRDGLCSGLEELTYCFTCYGTPQKGYLEQIAPDTTQIEAFDLCTVFEVCNYKVEVDTVEHQIEFLKEKLAAVDDMYTFMRIHSMYPSINSVSEYLSKLKHPH